jgi:DUF1680 family protein
MRQNLPPKSVVVDTSISEYARLRPAPLGAVTLEDSFWAPRLEKLREITLLSQYQQLEETGRIGNFRRVAGKVDQPFQGWFFNDSDVYKWVEVVSWTLATHDNPELRKMVDDVISVIEASQDENGYLNTYFTFEQASERWSNLKDMHELYCAGHLIQSAIAHYRSTGEDRLLAAAMKFADHICETFRPGATGKRMGTGGHPEIEMALVELARTTGQEKYLDQAKFFIDMRGQGLLGGQTYHQDGVPFRELTRMEGHAVRAVYLNAGATDLYTETGEISLLETLERLWLNMTTRQMYISGGIGSQYEGEAFGEDYELPNKDAYAETCASIANVMWNWRMLMLQGEARFADVLEKALYNAVLVGLGLDGNSYFYRNPLADDGDHRRQDWYQCACCPPNIARMLASLPGYFYSLSEEGIWLHLYAESSAQLELLDGRRVGLLQRTEYPWDGRIEVEIQGEGDFTLFLRIPSWIEGDISVALNGGSLLESDLEGGYLKVMRSWKRGDVLQFEFPMPVRVMESHPEMKENAGRVALVHGPLLYCLEGVDHPGLDLDEIVLPQDASLSTSFNPDLLDGVVILGTKDMVRPPKKDWGDQLYRRVGLSPYTLLTQSVEIKAIPYYAWGNREAGQMRVWIRRGDQGR